MDVMNIVAVLYNLIGYGFLIALFICAFVGIVLYGVYLNTKDSNICKEKLNDTTAWNSYVDENHYNCCVRYTILNEDSTYQVMHNCTGYENYLK